VHPPLGWLAQRCRDRCRPRPAHSSRGKKLSGLTSSAALRPATGCDVGRLRSVDRHRGRDGRGLENSEQGEPPWRTWRPASNRKPVRLQIGNSVRLASEFAPRRQPCPAARRNSQMEDARPGASLAVITHKNQPTLPGRGPRPKEPGTSSLRIGDDQTVRFVRQSHPLPYAPYTALPINRDYRLPSASDVDHRKKSHGHQDRVFHQANSPAERTAPDRAVGRYDDL